MQSEPQGGLWRCAGGAPGPREAEGGVPRPREAGGVGAATEEEGEARSLGRLEKEEEGEIGTLGRPEEKLAAARVRVRALIP